MRKTTKHAQYTIAEKNAIVEKYLKGEMGYTKLTRYYDLPSSSTLCYWAREYRKNGTLKDDRGNSGTNNPNFGKYPRKKKLIPEQMTHAELIEYVKATEDIKKLMVYLKRQKKNIK